MIKSITSLKVSGKRVLVRAGFDVPLEKNIHTEEWQVADDTRLRDGLPTLKYLIESKAKIVILSKLGRPGGIWDENLSSWPAAQKLGELLKYKTVKITKTLPDYAVSHIYFLTSDITKKDYSALSKKIPAGSILYLENLFFYAGEEAEDPDFVKVLKKYGDIYVDDAFSSAHHAAASNVQLAEAMPAYAGVTFLKEISALSKIFNPTQPMVVLLGGAKVDDKVETIENLAKNTNKLLVGGAIATTFLKAQGYDVGKSKVSDPRIAKALLRNYKTKIVLPVDVVVSDSPTGRAKKVSIDKIGPNEMCLDIGPETIRKFSEVIKTAKTLVWNGPMGKFENKQFAFGSLSLARIFAARCKGFAYGVVGGGETIEVLDQALVSEFVDHVSTGGGAMLEFLAGKKLPAIKA
ncbi:MAG TPA: phosphoglycerate kinase, partial [Methylomirabilota bacterium]|nr:phosphoglycerate kinase [Methylomirabilota bacterium]